MKTSYFFILVFISLIVFGCSRDKDLQKTIFYSDPEFPDLPKYSEWGYNTFGAFFDRKSFVSSDQNIPIKIVVHNDTTSFIFNGSLGNYDEMRMIIQINDFLPESYTDLTSLNQTYLDLENPAYRIQIKINDNEQEAFILDGGIDFIKAQHLLVDKEPTEVILSGKFEFQLLFQGEPITVSNGRFDLGIGYENFYNY